MALRRQCCRSWADGTLADAKPQLPLHGNINHVEAAVLHLGQWRGVTRERGPHLSQSGAEGFPCTIATGGSNHLEL